MQDRSLDIFARTLYGEARGEGEEGLEAVANVIMNRFRHPKWYTGYVVVHGKKIPDIAETCLKKAQFSCWNQRDPNREKTLNVTAEDKIFRQCLGIAARALNNGLIDFTNGADFYHTRTIQPLWAKGHTPCFECKNHLFYNDIH